MSQNDPTSVDDFNAAAVEKIIDLLSAGADPNGQDESGETILHRAGRSSSSQAVITLLDARANPNLPTHDGVTPLMAAVNAKKWANADFMLDYKADVNFQPTPQSMSPLYRAIVFDSIEGHTERTAFLLKRGANPDAVIVLPDDTKLTMAEWADKCDSDADRSMFSALFAQYTGRDIRRETINARLASEQQTRRMAALRQSGRADRAKFRLEPR